MLYRVYRLRRFIIVATIAGFGAGVGIMGGAGLLSGAIVAAMAMLITAMLAPDGRWVLLKTVVVVAVFAMIWRLAGGVVPEVYVLLLAIAVVLGLPSQPKGLDRFRLRGTAVAQVEVAVDQPSGALWDRLLPQPGQASWDPDVARVEPGPHPGTIVEVQRALPSRPAKARVLEVFDAAPGRSFKTRPLTADGAADPARMIVTSHEIIATDEGSHLRLTRAHWRPGLWTSISRWLDDALADEAEHMVACVAGQPDRSVLGAAQARRVAR